MKTKKQPERQCIGCHEKKEKRELIRIVKTPEGDIVLDRTGKKNGRGAYLCDSRECFEKARKTHALNRSFHIDVANEVYDELGRQFENDEC